MMKKVQVGVILALGGLFYSIPAMAQKGVVNGTVIDETGEPLFNASVVARGSTSGSATDFDGNFDLALQPGTHDLEVSFIGYSSIIIQDVKVESGESTNLKTIHLKPSSSQLEEAVITAEVLRNTESALLIEKKNAGNVMDGISAQSFRKIGDGDAAAAVKRVPGVSVEGGKYVYVRGLGDRYTKTMLNGMEVPGLDPDRNALQMDIFPTSIIENMMVVKSFSPEFPADFTGGIVNVETRSFPSGKMFGVSIGAAYTPGMHFNPDFLSYEGGSTDFLGFDDGTRKLPVDPRESIPDPASVKQGDGKRLEEVTRSFNPQLEAMRDMSFMNFNVGLSGGNQYKVGDNSIGWIGAVSYKNTTDFYDNWQQNFWQKPDAYSEYELRPDKLISGQLGINNVLASAMLGGAFKTSSSRYKLNVLRLQNAEKKAGYFSSEEFIGNPGQFYRDNLEYSERSLTNVLIAGEHFNNKADWALEWKLSPTWSVIEDKDVRVTPYEYDDGDFKYAPSTAENPERIWRELDEVNLASKVDVSNEHKLFDNSGKLKFGVSGVLKERDFRILNYFIKIDNYSSKDIDLSGNANEFLDPGFIWTTGTDTGSYIDGNYIPSNTYTSRSANFAVYISEEYQFSPLWKAIAGVRVEHFNLYYTGQDQKRNVYNNENFLNLFDWFPSASLIYSLDESTNIRTSYSRTTARPSFKEASVAQIEDVLTGITFIGNPDIEASYINNFDLRYEHFMDMGQIFSVSAFYKKLQNPIEIVSFAVAPDNVQPRNLGNAEVFGAEFELRHNFGFVAESLQNLMLNANLSVIESRLEFGSEQRQARVENARDGEEVGEYRPLQGQAPYMINTGISYQSRENSWEAGLYYNVQGEKLAIVGISQTPDIYTAPFHSLNFKVMKRFGSEDQFELSLSVDNILNDQPESYAKSYGSENKLYSTYTRGQNFGLNFKYAL